MLTFLINLDRSPERLQRTQAVFAKWGLSYSRMPGVDGRAIPVNTLSTLQQAYGNRRYFLKDLTPGEIGCFLSHQKCWEALVASQEDWAFICEDDLIFLSDPRPFITQTNWIPSEVGLIQLGKESTHEETVRREKRFLPVNNDTGARLLVLHSGIGGGCRGYMIRRDVAQLALSLANHIPAPVDDLLFSFASPLRVQAKPWSLSPSIIFTDDQGQSDIGNEKGKIKTSIWRDPLKYLQRKWINVQNSFYSTLACVKDQR